MPPSGVTLGNNEEKLSTGKFLRVGVTGGIGSGKSLVCSLFAKLGIPVISADDVAKEIMQSDDVLRRQLRALLGPSAYQSDGLLDRAYVAAKIFSNKSLQRKVNHLVHPLVEAAIDKLFLEFERGGDSVGIVEAALIYEAGFDKRLDLVIVVDASEAERIERVVKRDGTSADEVRKRINAQSPAEKKTVRADYVIRNTGSLSTLETSVEFLSAVLQTMSKKQ